MEQMKILKDIDKIKMNNTVVTMGKFDGFHIGHQLLLETAIAVKNDLSSAACSDKSCSKVQMIIFTFNIHPEKILEDRSYTTIQTGAEREQMVFPEGIDYLIEFPFNKETMSMTAEQFVKNILVDRLGVKVVVAGSDFRFGKDRQGDISTLKELGKVYGFEVTAVDKVKVLLDGCREEMEVSSTLIKQEILEGHMENAALMLGQPYSITGMVLHGKHLGTFLGYPTINLEVPKGKIMPPDGVYATRTIIEDDPEDSYYGITNVGTRPTFDDGEERTVETNLFDFNRDVYGRTVKVFFYRYIRKEQKFKDIEDLKEQMQMDSEMAGDYFGKNND